MKVGDLVRSKFEWSHYPTYDFNTRGNSSEKEVFFPTEQIGLIVEDLTDFYKNIDGLNHYLVFINNNFIAFFGRKLK